jgi:hypothetical protein
VVAVDVLVCPRSAGPRRILGAGTEPHAVADTRRGALHSRPPHASARRRVPGARRAQGGARNTRFATPRFPQARLFATEEKVKRLIQADWKWFNANQEQLGVRFAKLFQRT